MARTATWVLSSSTRDNRDRSSTSPSVAAGQCACVNIMLHGSYTHTHNATPHCSLRLASKFEVFSHSAVRTHATGTVCRCVASRTAQTLAAGTVRRSADCTKASVRAQTKGPVTAFAFARTASDFPPWRTWCCLLPFYWLLLQEPREPREPTLAKRKPWSRMARPVHQVSDIAYS